MAKKTDNIIRKKRASIFLTISILFLVALWIGEVFIGVLSEFEAETVKSLNGKKVVFLLDSNQQHKAEDNVSKSKEGVIPANMISLIIKLPDSENVKNIIESFPENVNFAISADDKNFNKKNHILKNLKASYLIRLPLENQKRENKLSIYPNIEKEELGRRLSLLTAESSAIGVYHEGNEDFLRKDLVSFANIISFLNKKDLFLLYGVNDKTTIFESDSENIFAVEACDAVIEADDNLNEKFMASLKGSKSENKSVILIKIKEDSVNAITNLMELITANNLTLVPLNQLPKSINTSNG